MQLCYHCLRLWPVLHGTQNFTTQRENNFWWKSISGNNHLLTPTCSAWWWWWWWWSNQLEWDRNSEKTNLNQIGFIHYVNFKQLDSCERNLLFSSEVFFDFIPFNNHSAMAFASFRQTSRAPNGLPPSAPCRTESEKKSVPTISSTGVAARIKNCELNCSFQICSSDWLTGWLAPSFPARAVMLWCVMMGWWWGTRGMWFSPSVRWWWIRAKEKFTSMVEKFLDVRKLLCFMVAFGYDGAAATKLKIDVLL